MAEVWLCLHAQKLVPWEPGRAQTPGSAPLTPLKGTVDELLP